MTSLAHASVDSEGFSATISTSDCYNFKRLLNRQQSFNAKSRLFVCNLSSKECQRSLVLSYEFEQRQVERRFIQRLAKETAS